jgi:AcrR family transcriptional regulator
MPRPRFDNLPADKRRRILEAAAYEFAEHGFKGASLNRIIETAGISKGAAYYYFDDKADVYATVLTEGWKIVLPADGLDLAALDRTTFWPTLRDRYQQMVAAAGQQPWLIAVGKLFYGSAPSPALGRIVADEITRVMAYVSDVIRHGQRVGAVRADVPAPLLVAVVGAALEAADRWSVEHAAELGPEGMDRLGTTLFDMIERFVAPPDRKRRR